MDEPAELTNPPIKDPTYPPIPGVIRFPIKHPIKAPAEPPMTPAALLKKLALILL